MSATNVWALGALVVGGSGTFTIKGVEQRQHEPGLDRVEVMAGGQPYPSWVSTMMISPTKKLTVSDLATLLTNVNPISGMAFPQSTTITTIDSFYTALSDGGVRKGSTSHMRVRANKGIAVIDSITLNNNQKATAEVTIYTTYDGTNVPFVFTTGVSLPATPAISELFTMGPVVINDATLADVTSVKIDLNPQMKIMSAGGGIGDQYPTFASIMTMSPKITISTNDVAALNTYGLAGTAVDSSNTHIFIRALTNMGTRVADATTSHIKIALSDSQGQVYVGPAGGSNTDHATGSIVIQPIAGSSAILTTSVGVAIA